MAKYFINLNEGLASNDFKSYITYTKLGGRYFNYDNFTQKDGSIVCNEKLFSQNLQKEKLKQFNLGRGTYGVVNSIVFDQQGLIKFSFKRAGYNSKNEMDDQDSASNVEVRMIKYISEKFTYSAVCPHFVTYIGHISCKSKSRNQKPYMVLMMEQCSTNLEKLIDSKSGKQWKYIFSSNDWDSIMFQIIFSLSVLQKNNKYFKHNDLKPDNIFINILPKPENFYYYLDGIYYSIQTRFVVKIADFGMSCIKNVIDHRDMYNGGFEYLGMNQNQNRNSDLYFLFSALYEYYFNSKTYNKEGKRINTSLMQTFLKLILHYKNNVKTYDGRYLGESENDNLNALPENLVKYFLKFQITKETIPNIVRIYSDLQSSERVNMSQNYLLIRPFVKLRKNIKILQKPVVMLETPFTNVTKDDFVIDKEQPREYTVLKRKETKPDYFEYKPNTKPEKLKAPININVKPTKVPLSTPVFQDYKKPNVTLKKPDYFEYKPKVQFESPKQYYQYYEPLLPVKRRSKKRLPKLTQQDKNHVLKLIKSKAHKEKCSKGKIPNYNVKGRCTAKDTLVGERLEKTFKIYKKLSKKYNDKEIKKIILK
jgi:hypothetical protein